MAGDGVRFGGGQRDFTGGEQLIAQRDRIAVRGFVKSGDKADLFICILDPRQGKAADIELIGIARGAGRQECGQPWQQPEDAVKMP